MELNKIIYLHRVETEQFRTLVKDLGAKNQELSVSLEASERYLSGYRKWWLEEQQNHEAARLENQELKDTIEKHKAEEIKYRELWHEELRTSKRYHDLLIKEHEKNRELSAYLECSPVVPVEVTEDLDIED